MKTKVTVYWEKEFIEEAKMHAKQMGISLSRLVEESIKEDIEEFIRKKNEK